MMKRLLALLAVCCLILSSACADGSLRGYSTSDGYVYATFGQYMQSIDGGIPEESKNTWKWSSKTIKDPTSIQIHTDPILWRVLDSDEEKAYLASEYVLFAMPLHKKITEYKTLGTDFGTTELCAYLNNDFAAAAFTEEEQSALLENGTMGKVFLLNSADVKNKAYGMGNSTGKYPGMKCWGTEYAIRVTKLFVYRTSSGSHSPYWVADQSTADARHGRCTKATGTLGHIICDRDNEGVRPAIHLDLSAIEILSGTGTKADPYVIGVKQE